MTRMPRWRLVVIVVGAAAGVVLALAILDLASTGLRKPLAAGLGLLATLVVNRVYVVVALRGQVIEGIDIAEASILALAFLLPAGEAVLVFVAASCLIELFADRARVKKVFNVGVRAVGAGVVVLAVAIVGRRSAPGVAEFGAAVLGAIGYTLVNVLAVAAVVSSVHGRRTWVVLREDARPRLLTWALAVVIGTASGYAALQAPGALAAVMAALVLVLLAAIAAQSAQQDSRRLRHLLDATTRIQAATVPEEQEQILLDVGSELLLWKDVDVRDDPPELDERGARVYDLEGRQRWLVARPRVGSDPWTVHDLRVIDTLAGAAAVARERAGLQAELTRQALLDPLTGVANRRRFDEEVARLCADSRPRFSLILCDLDHFKTVNDRLGHDAGDELLRIAAARLLSCVRAEDLVARLGGDEFVVLLPGVVSRANIEAIRAKITARFAQPVRVGRWQLSCLPSSLGIASAPGDGITARDVLRAADESMYDVKRAHRVTPPPMSVTLPEARRSSDSPMVVSREQQPTGGE